MKIKFDIRLQAKDLYAFNLYQNYFGGLSGVFSVIIGILFLVMAGNAFQKGQYGYTAIYVLASIAVIGYTPILLRGRARIAIATNESLSSVLHYEIDEKAIHVKQKDEAADLPWGDVYKVVSTRSVVLIYTNRINAYIIPKDQLGEKYYDFRMLAENALPLHRCKLH